MTDDEIERAAKLLQRRRELNSTIAELMKDLEDVEFSLAEVRGEVPTIEPRPMNGRDFHLLQELKERFGALELTDFSDLTAYLLDGELVAQGFSRYNGMGHAQTFIVVGDDILNRNAVVMSSDKGRDKGFADVMQQLQRLMWKEAQNDHRSDTD